ncbi:MAG: hypothetical protein MUP70_13985, partial [Candidatus Aminicenantes bacterium]|nr:hypothetical protein [Candidatus Aminicenantes bacterium]
MSDDFVSVLNDVLGPVMRGPSSSHTAASHRIGKIARDLLGELPVSARFIFDPDGSYGKVYRQQGVDLALISGILDRSITDDGFKNSLSTARKLGIDVRFELQALKNAIHPNTIDLFLEGHSGRKLEARARSTGGGLIQFDSVNGWPVVITGKSHHCLIRIQKQDLPILRDTLEAVFPSVWTYQTGDGAILAHIQSATPFPADFEDRIRRDVADPDIRTCPPVFYPQHGEPIFRTGGDMVHYA